MKSMSNYIDPFAPPPLGKIPTNTIIASNKRMEVGEVIQMGVKLFRITRQVSEFEFHMQLEANRRRERVVMGESTIVNNVADAASVRAKKKPAPDMRYFYRAAYVPPEAD
jgi:hypothetical protein